MTIDKILKPIYKSAASLGIDLKLFPGIPILLLIFGILTIEHIDLITNIIGVNQDNKIIGTILKVSVPIFLSIMTYYLTGDIVDWFYDKFYWQKTNNDSELKKQINIAELIWEERDESFVKKKDSVYRKTKELMKNVDKKSYKELRSQLNLSKTFRNITLPLILLIGINVFKTKWIYVLIVSLFLVISLSVCFRLRAEQSIKLYKWLQLNKDR